MTRNRNHPFSYLHVTFAALLLPLTYIAYAIYFNVIKSPDVSGNFDISILQDYKAPLIASTGTFAGVISKSVYEFLSDRPTDLRKGLLSASLIAPIVVMYTYNAISSINDTFVSFLIAYQNGFCFRVILASVENGLGRGPKQ